MAVISIKTWIDRNCPYSTSPNGKMISRLLVSVSQNEFERTSERTKIGLAGAIKCWQSMYINQ